MNSMNTISKSIDIKNTSKLLSAGIGWSTKSIPSTLKNRFKSKLFDVSKNASKCLLQILHCILISDGIFVNLIVAISGCCILFRSVLRQIRNFLYCRCSTACTWYRAGFWGCKINCNSFTFFPTSKNITIFSNKHIFLNIVHTLLEALDSYSFQYSQICTNLKT